jgi:hypothetical protein
MKSEKRHGYIRLRRNESQHCKSHSCPQAKLQAKLSALITAWYRKESYVYSLLNPFDLIYIACHPRSFIVS